MKCVIIEPDKQELEALFGGLSMIPNLEIVAFFDSVHDAEALVSKKNIDIVFCAVQMPDINGIMFFKSMQKPLLFVFLADDMDYSRKSFELGALDYILKPISLDRLLIAVDKARVFLLSQQRLERQKKFLAIKDRKSTVILLHKTIYYLKSDKDYVKIATKDRNYTIWKNLGDMEQSLALARRFLRVHKSYIINLDFAEKIECGCIQMKGNLGLIPIGDKYKADLYKRLGLVY